MPRRKKISEQEETVVAPSKSKEKTTKKAISKKAAEAPVATKRRGRPKKEAKPATAEVFEESVSAEEQPAGIVLKHYTEAEIAIEGKRKRIMWLSVSFIAVLVLFVWAANLKRIVGVDASSSAAPESFKSFSESFIKGFRQVNSSVKELRNEVASSSDEASATSSQTYDTNVEEINEQLKTMIENASSTVNNQ